MRTLLHTILLIFLLVVFALALDRIALLKQITLYLSEHPDPLRAITIGMSIVGWMLLIGAFVLGFLTQGKLMREQNAKSFMQSGLHSRLYGKVIGREFRGASTFSEIKQVLHTGAWVHDSTWHPLLLGLIAVPLIAYGMFGFFIVIGPLLVKGLCAGALLYATVRTVLGFWQA